MASFQEYKRRGLIPLVGLVLGTYYVTVYVPLADRAARLDKPLLDSRHKLELSLAQSNSPNLDFRHITNQLSETRRALNVFLNARQRAAARLELSPSLRARLNATFQLFEYQNERSQELDECERLARQQKVGIDAAVLTGFPEHTADTREPNLLWAALAFSDSLVRTAIRCQLQSLHSLEVPLALTNSPTEENLPHWAEIPIRLEFTASAENAARFIHELPLRSSELPKSAASGPAAGDKAPLFIDRLIIRKQNPEKLDEVRVWLQATGFVQRE